MIKNTNSSEIIIKPCTSTELAAAYGISVKVLRRWLHAYPQLHNKTNRGYNLQQVVFIIENIGLPFYTVKV